MNLADEEGAYNDKEEEEEDEEEQINNTSSKLLFSPQFSSSSSSKYPQQNHSWIHQDSQNFDKMDLSLATNTTTTTTNIAEIDQNYSPSAAGSSSQAIEKEHMFDKVVTPSDVGKLNRLVIPKQHAEKYFPLDSSSNEKGLLLNFEDRNGKPWRFRYSYWNSSQSYVMTKGWSRFVKEKKLDAGDIVSFQRGIGEAGKNRLYIDWRRRPNMVSDPSSFPHLDQHHQIQHNSIHFPPRWTGRLYQPQFQQIHFNSAPSNFLHHHVSQYPYNSPPHYYNLRPPQAQVQVQTQTQPAQHHHQQQLLHHHQHLPMVLDSVPVAHGKTVGKRLRLFGVNMECPTEDEDNESPNSGSSNSNSVHQFAIQTEFSKKGKSTNSSSSLSVDLDL